MSLMCAPLENEPRSDNSSATKILAAHSKPGIITITCEVEREGGRE